MSLETQKEDQWSRVCLVEIGERGEGSGGKTHSVPDPVELGMVVE